MNKNIIIAMVSIAAVVAIAGCIGFGGGGDQSGTGYPGVIITEFSPTISNVRAGSPIDFLVTVQNQGQFDAKNANVVIFNCGPSSTGASDARPGEEYKCNEPVFKNNFNLAKPNREVEIAGEVKDAEVTLNTDPAHFPEGRTQQTFSARVSYEYMTTGVIDVAFTTFANYKAKGGKVLTGPLNAFSEPAPLSLFLNAPHEPVIIDNPNDQKTFTVGVSIRNTGGGFVQGTNPKQLKQIKLCYDSNFVDPIFGTDEKYSDFNRAIDINADGIADCLVIDELDDNVENLRLVGQTNQYRDVDAKFRNVAGKIGIQDVTTFDAELIYTYTLDRTTVVVISNV